MDTDIGKDEAPDIERISESRRKFLQAAGKIAVYTPPAMMLLMNPSAEAFARSAGGDDKRKKRRERKRKGKLDKVKKTKSKKS